MTEWSNFEVRQAPDDAKIWRYMSLSKYKSLLKSSGLYLAPLTVMEDQFEGTLPPDMQVSNQLRERHMPEIAVSLAARVLKSSRGRIMINCWHLNSGESDAMWKLYCGSDEAVCLETTYGQLKAELPAGAKMGLVNYVDFDEVRMPTLPGSLEMAFLKRQAFSHESEVRVFLSGLGDDEYKARFWLEFVRPNTKGVVIPVNLPKIVNSIRVHPSMGEGFVRKVEQETQELGYAFGVSPSELSPRPSY